MNGADDLRSRKSGGSFNRKNSLALLITPVIIVVLAFLLVDARGPYSRGENYDPDYIYLESSVNLLIFHGPGYTDHPGTTLQEGGAAVIFGRWVLASTFGNKWVPLQEATLRDPEEYLHSINTGLVFLIAAAVFVAGSRMYRLSGSLFVALVLQASVFLFREPLLSLPHVSPEPLLIATAYVFMLPLMSFALTKQPLTRSAIAAGLIFGFGLVTKVTCLAWVCFAAVFGSWKQRAQFAGAALAGSLAFALPILDQGGKVLRWFLSLLIHDDKYGGGNVGLPSAGQFAAHVRELLRAEPGLVCWLAFYIAVFLALRFGAPRRENQLFRRIERLLGIGCITIMLQLAMAGKHYMAPRYIVPCLVILPLLNACVALLFFAQVLPRNRMVPFAVCGIVLFVAGLGITLPRVKAAAIEGRIRQDRGKELQERIRCKDCILIGAYGSSAGHAALAFGDGYSNYVLGKVLSELYPDAVYYDIFQRHFVSLTNESRETLVRRWFSQGRRVMLQGAPFNADNKPPGFTLRLVASDDREGLYEMTSMDTLLPSEAPATAVVIEATSVYAGSAIIDRTEFGKGLPIVRTFKDPPTWAEFWIRLPAPGRYELRGRCASQTARPVSVSVDGRKLTESFCGLPTGGYYKESQQWQSSGVYDFQKATVSMRLDCAGPFPHISAIALVPVERTQ